VRAEAADVLQAGFGTAVLVYPLKDRQVVAVLESRLQQENSQLFFWICCLQVFCLVWGQLNIKTVWKSGNSQSQLVKEHSVMVLNTFAAFT